MLPMMTGLGGAHSAVTWERGEIVRTWCDGTVTLVYLLLGAAVNLGTVPTPQEGVGIDLRLVAPMPLGPDMVFGPHWDAVHRPVLGAGQDCPFGVPEDFDLPPPVQPI